MSSGIKSGNLSWHGRRVPGIEKSKKERTKEALKKSRIKDLIEFSRAVHAEMHALLNLSVNSSNKKKELSLFCTTYPCHNCARHIVAAGIKRVVFIEPYPKSLEGKEDGN